MPFLTPTCITDQESGQLDTFYDRMADLLFLIRQSTVVCNKISRGEIVSKNVPLKKVKILKSQFECVFKMN